MADIPDISYPSNSGDASKRGRKVLPHWELEGGCYGVTFRLGDSLPRSVLDSFIQERDALAEVLRTKGELTDVEMRSLTRVMNEKVGKFRDRLRIRQCPCHISINCQSISACISLSNSQSVPEFPCP